MARARPFRPDKRKNRGSQSEWTVRPDIGDFFFTGTGRRGTITEDWEYRYHGHLTRNWPNAAADQRPFLVGSVLRAKSHNGVPIRSPAGVTFSFIAVKQRPPFTWELSGSWAYRGFHNEIAPQPAHELILQQAVLKLESPPPHTLEGAIEWPGGFLDLKGTVRHGKEFTNFELVGTGRRGTSTEGWEYRYHGYPGWGAGGNA